MKSDGTVISSLDYAYDSVGNRTRVLEADGNRVTWTYDNKYQLTRERRSGANSYDITYTYDPVGNRKVKIDGGVRTTYSYDAANELLTLKDSSGTTTFTYDASGNQETKTEPSGGVTTNTWDFENRLAKVILPSGSRNTFSYNADGQRVKKEDTVGTSKFLWDQENVLLETDGSDVTQVVYTLKPAGFGNLVLQRRSGAAHYYHFDGLGSTDRITNSAQTVTDSYTYQAFGEIIASSGTTPNPFRYVGRHGYYYDTDLADYYLRRRQYGPDTARFLSPDPQFAAGVSNLYIYVSNNPMNFVDFSGLQEEGEKEKQVWYLYCRPLGAEDDGIFGKLPAQFRHCYIVCNGRTYSMIPVRGKIDFFVDHPNERERKKENGCGGANGGGNGPPRLRGERVLVGFGPKDMCECLEKTVDAQTEIDNGPYDPFDCNSNYFAATLLTCCGVERDRFRELDPKPIGWDDCDREDVKFDRKHCKNQNGGEVVPG